jgi:flagellar biogenesis protein FliO
MSPLVKPGRFFVSFWRVASWMIGVASAFLIVSFGLLTLTTGTAIASTQMVESSSSQAVTTPEMVPSFTRLLITLLMICGLGILLIRFFSRSKPQPTKSLSVLAALPINSRCTVYLVQASDRRLLVGVDPFGIKALVELPGDPPEQFVTTPTKTNFQPGTDQIEVLLTRLRSGNRTATT